MDVLNRLQILLKHHIWSQTSNFSVWFETSAANMGWSRKTSWSTQQQKKTKVSTFLSSKSFNQQYPQNPGTGTFLELEIFAQCEFFGFWVRVFPGGYFGKLFFFLGLRSRNWGGNNFSDVYNNTEHKLWSDVTMFTFVFNFYVFCFLCVGCLLSFYRKTTEKWNCLRLHRAK